MLCGPPPVSSQGDSLEANSLAMPASKSRLANSLHKPGGYTCALRVQGTPCGSRPTKAMCRQPVKKQMLFWSERQRQASRLAPMHRLVIMSVALRHGDPYPHISNRAVSTCGSTIHLRNSRKCQRMLVSGFSTTHGTRLRSAASRMAKQWS